MVIKSMTRKTASFSQLLDYIAGAGKSVGLPVVHNLQAEGDDLKAVGQEFRDNAEYCPPRKKGIVLYHEILSIAEGDFDSATPEILADLAEHYLSLRAPGALAYGAVHFEKNPHMHLVISGNLLHQAKKLRLSRQEFDRVKRDLERYQQDKYPELVHSLVFENNRQLLEQKRSGQEYDYLQLQQKGRGAVSRKEMIQNQILAIIVKSSSLVMFIENLQEHRIALYTRKQQYVGVLVQGKKYRFRTLALDQAFQKALRHWQRLPERQQSIAGILMEKSRQQSQEYPLQR